jgi:hypothetical protein
MFAIYERLKDNSRILLAKTVKYRYAMQYVENHIGRDTTDNSGGMSIDYDWENYNTNIFYYSRRHVRIFIIEEQDF